MEKLSVQEYFEYPETTRPMELVYGVVRDPAMPAYDHQRVATRLIVHLASHVDERGAGEILSPMDVVLDEAAALVVQPDVVFVSRERRAIIRERIWGPPDLVGEILSPATARRDRTVKVAWYRQYGVRECWLIGVREGSVEVLDLQAVTAPALFAGPQRVRSLVLPELVLRADHLFE